MKKSSSLDDKLARLRALEAAPMDDEAVKELRKALAGANNILIAKAAQIAAARGLTQLAPGMVEAFRRCLENPLKTDRGCMAKIAIAEALNQLDYDGDEVFLRGIRHVQLEPAFGPPVDTADALRAQCAYGLVRLNHRETLRELTMLLADGEVAARRAAVKALAATGRNEAELLLRFKALAGDADADVLWGCFAGLMSLAPDTSTRFVAGYLRASDEQIAEGAAIALGESRVDEAFELLRECWENSVGLELRKTLLLPMALTRREEAFEFLLAVLREQGRSTATAAAAALKILAVDGERRERIEAALADRGDRDISKHFLE